MAKTVPFTIVARDNPDNYYGFTLENNPLHIMPNGVVFHNSGKSVLEQSIVGHVSRYSDRYQLVGVDCKRVEFNLLRGVKGVKGVALDVPTAADAVANFQKIMMDRFKFMEQMQVNNVYKIKEQEVDYYEVFGEKVQFDEIYELTVDLDQNDRNYNKMKQIYADGRQPLIMTIEAIYNGMQEGTWDDRHPQLPEKKGFNSYIDKNTIRKSRGIYTPKILLFLADELNELMTSDDFKSVDTVKGALGSIARLGRAAGVHLALACQRASGNTISADLKNNIQMCCLLGGFDDGASQLMFEKDISNLAKPQIKGRGFVGSGQEIIETQTYYTQPEKDWEFDTSLKMTYNNPVFTEQCKLRKIEIDNTGWVEQVPFGKQDKMLVQEVDEFDDDFDDFNDDFDDDFKPRKKSKLNHPPHKDFKDFKDGDLFSRDIDDVNIKIGGKEVQTNIGKDLPDLDDILEKTEPTKSDKTEPTKIVSIPTELSDEDIADIFDEPVEKANPKIKLNLNKKPKIKLNIKSKK